jgi:hypothetical protein
MKDHPIEEFPVLTNNIRILGELNEFHQLRRGLVINSASYFVY